METCVSVNRMHGAGPVARVTPRIVRHAQSVSVGRCLVLGRSGDHVLHFVRVARRAVALRVH